MASVPGENFLSYEEKKLSVHGIFMDVDAPKMLTLKMLEGSLEGLTDPHSILLPASGAKALFGNRSALDNIVTIDNRHKVRVTGVYEDLPDSSTFRNIGFIAAWELYRTSQQWIINSVNKWDNNSFQLFVQIAGNTSFDAVGRQIGDAKQKFVDPEDKKYQTKLGVLGRIIQPRNL
jgi:putative ABC transport system permease protein